MRYFMGIDNGGTLVKAVIFDENGVEVATASEKLPLITPKHGFTERDMDELFAANIRVIHAAVQKSQIDPAQIKGVGCAGHGKGLYLWGKDDKPAYHGIVSTDTRAWRYAEKWRADGTEDRIFEKTCQSILPCQPVSLLNWFKDNQPNVLGRVQWIFSVKDYIRFRLTGEAYAELTDISGTNLLNLHTREYDLSLLAEFGLEECLDMLPPLRKATDICGCISKEVAQMTGLCEGTPVAGGMFDIDACAIAMDITNEEHICVIAGTWSINEYIAKAPIRRKSTTLNSLYCIDGYYLVEESSPTSAGNNEWFVETFFAEEKAQARLQNRSVYALNDEMAERVAPDEQDIVFLPYIFGSNTNPHAKACLIGLDSHHTHAQIIRAVYEGIALCHRGHVENLLVEKEKPISIRLAGGVVNSALWSQIFADVLRLPIEIIETKELGALGCAMAAAVASKCFSSFADAAKQMVRINRCLQPNEEAAAIYDKKYRRFLQASEAVEVLWSNQQAN